MTESPASIVVLLGRRDEPTDAVEDYAQHLSAALGRCGVSLELIRMHWAGQGWLAARRWLLRQAPAWKGQWILVQYTALAWSRRGIPLGFLAVLGALKRCDAKIAIVFHDPLPFPGSRWKDRARRWIQQWVMRRSARAAHRIVSAIPPECVPWMRDPRVREKLVVIPIGSNVPECSHKPPHEDSEIPTIAVFGITERNQQEAEQIARVVKGTSAQVGTIRLLVVGRGALEAERFLRSSLDGSRVQLDLRGIIPPEEISSLLSTAHVQLFVRSGIASRRGSVVAGIACGLPVVGWAGEETAFPVTEAGIRVVPHGDETALIRELSAVLTNEGLRSELQQRSRRAAAEHFSWDVVALCFLTALDLVPMGQAQGATHGQS